MKINPDCIRDILLEVEKNSSFHSFYEYTPKSLSSDSYLAKYDADTVLYHIRQCDLCGYLFNTNWQIFEYVGIEDLTPEGHEFLANIRDDSLWKKTLAKGAEASLPILFEIAKEIAFGHFLS